MSESGPAQSAWNSLTPNQQQFIQSLPKADLHAHLNGSIPLPTLLQLAQSYTGTDILQGIEKLKGGIKLKEINDFFALFPAIYTLTSSPSSLSLSVQATIESLLAHATYIELRTTPRNTNELTRLEYVKCVLDQVEKWPEEKVGGLILSLDRRMSDSDLSECVEILLSLHSQGRRVIGIDLCGPPLSRHVRDFLPFFKRVKEQAPTLGATLHIAETEENTEEESLFFINEYQPDRLGHATFLSCRAREAVSEKTTIEICLTSNLLCKTVQKIDDHHVRHWIEKGWQVGICTDDATPFNTNLTHEYALLLASAPLGLGLTEDEVRVIAKGGFRGAFNGKVRNN